MKKYIVLLILMLNINIYAQEYYLKIDDGQTKNRIIVQDELSSNNANNQETVQPDTFRVYTSAGELFTGDINSATELLFVTDLTDQLTNILNFNGSYDVTVMPDHTPVGQWVPKYVSNPFILFSTSTAQSNIITLGNSIVTFGNNLGLSAREVLVGCSDNYSSTCRYTMFTTSAGNHVTAEYRSSSNSSRVLGNYHILDSQPTEVVWDVNYAVTQSNNRAAVIATYPEVFPSNLF